MQTDEDRIDAVAGRKPVFQLAAILVEPRRTIRGILDNPPDRMVPVLVALAILSRLFRDFHWQSVRNAFQAAPPVPMIVASSFFAGALAMIVLYFLFAWMIWIVARAFFDGHAPLRAVRSALAWSLAPMIWALLYRIPAAFLLPPLVSPEKVAGVPFFQALRAVSKELTFGRWFPALVILLLNLVVLIWIFVLGCINLSEAEEFSTWNAAATLFFTILAPFIVVGAALLAHWI